MLRHAGPHSPIACEHPHVPYEEGRGHGHDHGHGDRGGHGDDPGERRAQRCGHTDGREHSHDEGHTRSRGHDHGHDHEHGHDQRSGPSPEGPPRLRGAADPPRRTVVEGGSPTQRQRARRALAGSLVLTLVMMVVEWVGAWWTGSLLLLSDAVHMAAHAIALGISWVGVRLATVPTGGRNHFGLYRAEVLAAFLNGLGVLGTTFFIVLEAVERARAPEPVRTVDLGVIAALGLVVNLVTAWWLHRAGGSDLNTRSAMVHMVTDAVSSVAVLLGAAVMLVTQWYWIDPALSLLVAAIVLRWGWDLLRESGAMLLELAPRGLDLSALRADLVAAVPGVVDVHDVHVWDITTGYRCATMHLVLAGGHRPGAVRGAVAEWLRVHHGVGHATLQVDDPV